MVEDKTTDKNVPQEARDYVRSACEIFNDQKRIAKLYQPRFVITEFEIKGEIQNG